MGADLKYRQVLLQLLHVRGYKRSGIDGRAGSVFYSTGKPDNGIRNSDVYIWFTGGV